MEQKIVAKLKEIQIIALSYNDGDIVNLRADITSIQSLLHRFDAKNPHIIKLNRIDSDLSRLQSSLVLICEKSFEVCKSEFDAEVGGIINEIEFVGMSKPQITSSRTYNNTINNNISQFQNQQISIDIFIEAIKDDLTGKQVRELKEIVSQEGDDLEKAKPKILDKVISWGGNVAAGIVTNLLTNPVIWGGL